MFMSFDVIDVMGMLETHTPSSLEHLSRGLDLGCFEAGGRGFPPRRARRNTPWNDLNIKPTGNDKELNAHFRATGKCIDFRCGKLLSHPLFTVEFLRTFAVTSLFVTFATIRS